MSKLKVSVIIPVFNSFKYLEETITSVIKQTLKEIEIIIINDGSQDSSEDIIKKYQKIDNRIIYVTQRNQGTSITRNIGISIANAEYINFLDSDDYIESDMLRCMYLAAKSKNIDIVVSRFQRVDDSKAIKYIGPSYSNYTKEEIFKELISFNIPSITCNVIFRKRLFDDNNCFFPKKNIYNEDTLTIFKLFYFANSVLALDNVYYNWRDTLNSKSNSISMQHIIDIFYVLKSTKKFLLQYNIFEQYNIEFLLACCNGILNRYHKIKKFENNTNLQNKILEYLYTMISKERIFNSKNDIKILKQKYPYKYYKTLTILLKSRNQEILTYFDKKDILKLQSNPFLKLVLEYIINTLPLSVKSIYIYGAGEITKILLELLNKTNIKITTIIDRQIKKIEINEHLYPVKNIESTDLKNNSYIIIASIAYQKEINTILDEYVKHHNITLNIITIQ